jgi:hypothetical protein
MTCSAYKKLRASARLFFPGAVSEKGPAAVR